MMVSWLERMIWASLSAGAAGLVVLALCRLPGLSALVKVWICRLASLKFAFSLLTAVAVPVVLLPASAGTETQAVADGNLVWLAVWLGTIWIAGIVVVARHLAQASRVAKTLLSQSEPPPTGIEELVRSLSARMGLTGAPAVRTSPHLSQPCVFQAAGTMLLLPDSAEAPDTRHILAHEVAHVRHRDLAWGRVQAVVFAMFWFHPVVAWLEREARLWQEVAADAAARAATDVEPRMQASSIVEALTGVRRLEQSNLVTLGQLGNVETVSRRIKALYEGPASLALAFVAVAAAAVGLLPIRPATPTKEELWRPKGLAEAVDVTMTPVPTHLASPVRRLN